MKPRKKILYVITKSNLGGAQRYVLELATGLSSEDYEVVVACGGAGPLKERLEAAGIVVHTIKNFERDINLSKELAALRELWHIIRKEKPDIVHLNSSKAGGSGALVARLLSVKTIIFTAHGWPFNEPRGRLWRFLVWFFSYLTTLFVHRVIVVSTHDLTGARMPGLLHKLTLIHTAIPAIPAIPFKPRAEARTALFPGAVRDAHEHDLWLVSTGEHTPNKNLKALIRALNQLLKNHHHNLFLTLMGDGEERTSLEKLVCDLGIERHVFFTGFVPEARTYLSAFDIFVLPSHKEGFPYGLLEAGAAQLPAIASAAGGIPELIRNNETGILTDPNDTTSLVTAIKTLSEDPDLAARLAEHLHREVTHTYTLSTMLEKTEAVYQGAS